MVALWLGFPHSAPIRPDRPQGPPTSSEASGSWWTSRSWSFGNGGKCYLEKLETLTNVGDVFCEAGNWKITNWVCLKIGYIPNEIAIE